MAIKADKLSQILENFQQFLHKSLDDCEDFKQISKNLARLHSTLEQKKISVQIVSEKLALAQELYDLIFTNEQLKTVFELKFDTLVEVPEKSGRQQIASLKFKEIRDKNIEIRQNYQLQDNKTIAIGRCPESDITLSSKLYQGVSWNHLKIQPIINNSKITQWQICDLQSTNGTFVNGKRVEKLHLLESGDKITLASPNYGAGVAEIVFDLRNETINSKTNLEYWDLIDCDLMLIVIDSQEPLSIKEKSFIKNFDAGFISQQYIIAKLPNFQQDTQAEAIATTNLENLATWINNEVTTKELELISLYLESANNTGTDLNLEIDKKLLKTQTSFFKLLENLVKRQPENLLAKRLFIKLIAEVESIKPFYLNKIASLTQTIAAEEAKIASLNQVNWKEVSKSTITEIERGKDLLFKQIKSDLSQSKAAILDNYSKKSIIYTIQDFVDNLTPTITTQNGQKIIILKDESRPDFDDLNLSLINFCVNSLKTWTSKEWQKITNIYNNGGLNGFLKRTTHQINVVPNLFTSSPFTPPSDLDLEGNFLISFVGTTCTTTYKQKSLIGYIVKELRGNIMATLMPVMLIIPFIVSSKVSKNQIIGKFPQLFNKFPWLLGLVVCAIVYFLVNKYNQQNENDIEASVQKIKKDLANYYQSFTKNLLDKILQDINLALEIEAQKISDALETIDSTYLECLSDAEKQQLEIRNNLEQYKNQQKTLETELAEFNKLTKI
ncbi:FHA domain containing protein [Chondrocystis sp. NIES-4102]|nr:FHA domain containing protein [Chondrocystis sp. NIES-4102]